MGCKKEKRSRLLPMDELQYRPCEVDGVPALFHRWVEEDSLLFRDAPLGDTMQKIERRRRSVGLIPRDCGRLEVLRETFALVEFRDGTVAKVKPELVRFVIEEGGNV